MSPENNALDRTYFIGGPPRIGKTTLAYKIAEKISGHVVSTDAIRTAVKKGYANKVGPLFNINKYNDYTEQEWLSRYSNPETVIKDQNEESEAFWRSIVAFCGMFCEDDANHIVEGVALLPKLVAQMENKPKHVAFVGNTSDKHLETILEYSKRNPEKDWLVRYGYGEDRIVATAKFVQVMSFYFKNEAEKYGFEYFELSDDDFESDKQKVISALLK